MTYFWTHLKTTFPDHNQPKKILEKIWECTQKTEFRFLSECNLCLLLELSANLLSLGIITWSISVGSWLVMSKSRLADTWVVVSLFKSPYSLINKDCCVLLFWKCKKLWAIISVSQENEQRKLLHGKGCLHVCSKIWLTPIRCFLIGSFVFKVLCSTMEL